MVIFPSSFRLIYEMMVDMVDMVDEIMSDGDIPLIIQVDI